MNCPYCNRSVPEESVFCQWCGRRLFSGTGIPQGVSEAGGATPKERPSLLHGAKGTRIKKAWLAALLNFLFPPLGYLYAGVVRWWVWPMLALLVLDLVIMLFADIGDTALILPVALGCCVGILLDALLAWHAWVYVRSEEKARRMDALVVTFYGLSILIGILIGIVTAIQRSEKPIMSLGKRVRTVYVDRLPSDVDPRYAGAVRDALAYWEQRLGVTFRETLSEDEADIRVGWVKEWGGEALGRTVSRIAWIGLGDSQCMGKWRPYGYDTVVAIAKHEIGHAIGMGHSEVPGDVMYGAISPKYDVMIDEWDVLGDGWYRFFPNCGYGDPTIIEVTVTSDEEVDIILVPSVVDFQRFRDGQSYEYYPKCSYMKTRAVEFLCAIDRGGGIILRNPTVFGLGPAARVHIVVREK